MQLKILTATSKKTAQINWLEVETTLGNFVIQQGHAPTVLILKPGKEITFSLANGTKESTTIQEGLAHITRTSATIIITNK